MPRASTALPAVRLTRKSSGSVLSALYPFDAADLFDQEPQRGIDEVLVQLRMADAIREGDFSNFSRHAGPEAECRSQDALGNDSR